VKIALVIVATLLVIGVGYWVLGMDKEESTVMTTEVPASQRSNSDKSDTSRLIIGEKDAPVTIVEYGDFKCPNCAKFHLQAGQGIRQDYIETNQAKIEFRNIALIGPDSQRAAQGAYCANDQNKFAQYHDAVYEHMWNNYYAAGDYQSEFEDVLTQELLTNLAVEQGMNKQQFETCLSSGKYTDALQDDLDEAEEDGARGTPYFVIGDQTVTGPQPYNVFKTLIDLQLQ
jgi:protein-disulfide isomerase